MQNNAELLYIRSFMCAFLEHVSNYWSLNVMSDYSYFLNMELNDNCQGNHTCLCPHITRFHTVEMPTLCPTYFPLTFIMAYQVLSYKRRISIGIFKCIECDV